MLHPDGLAVVLIAPNDLRELAVSKRRVTHDVKIHTNLFEVLVHADVLRAHSELWQEQLRSSNNTDPNPKKQQLKFRNPLVFRILRDYMYEGRATLFAFHLPMFYENVYKLRMTHLLTQLHSVMPEWAKITHPNLVYVITNTALNQPTNHVPIDVQQSVARVVANRMCSWTESIQKKPFRVREETNAKTENQNQLHSHTTAVRYFSAQSLQRVLNANQRTDAESNTRLLQCVAKWCETQEPPVWSAYIESLLASVYIDEIKKSPEHRQKCYDLAVRRQWMGFAFKLSKSLIVTDKIYNKDDAYVVNGELAGDQSTQSTASITTDHDVPATNVSSTLMAVRPKPDEPSQIYKADEQKSKHFSDFGLKLERTPSDEQDYSECEKSNRDDDSDSLSRG